MSKRSESKLILARPIWAIISGSIAIFVSILQWNTSFTEDNPTTMLGMDGKAVNSYIFYNISNGIIGITFFIFVYQMYIYFSGKNAHPEVIFSGRWGDRYARIKIRNGEPVAITDLSAKIVAFSYKGYLGDAMSGDSLKTSFPERVITQEDFVFAQVDESGFLEVKLDNFTFSEPIESPKKKHDPIVARANVVVEFFGRLEDEKQIISLGQYYFELVQKRFLDNGGLRNRVGFENFRHLTKAEKKTPTLLVKSNSTT